MRLIDADAMKSYIDCGHLRPPTELCFSELDVVRTLDRMPTIDAEPVRHGRWVETKIGFHCSECKKKPGIYPTRRGAYLSNYCPKCGAKMDAEVGG